jgi:hypothetical protein
MPGDANRKIIGRAAVKLLPLSEEGKLSGLTDQFLAPPLACDADYIDYRG